MKKFIFILLGLLIILSSFSISIAKAQAPAPPPIVKKVNWTKEEVIELIKKEAAEHNVSADTMVKVIACESSFVKRAIGDSGKSHGLAQIHSPSHPTITLEQAEDPEFAVNFMAENISKGKGNLWTCYRKIIQK